MKTQSNQKWSFDDIVFEHRNKHYGAYALRATYHRRLYTAGFAALLFFSLALLAVTRTWTKEQIISILPQETLVLADVTPDEPIKPVAQKAAAMATQTDNFFHPDGQAVEKPIRTDIMIGNRNQSGNKGSGSPTSTGGEIDDTFDIGGGDVDFEDKSDKPVHIAQDMPQFPGGDVAMMKFINSQVALDRTWADMGLSGKIIIEFVVDKEGNVTSVRAVTGPYEVLKKTGVKAIKAMPKWKPGKQNGREVSVILNIPINFVLQ